MKTQTSQCSFQGYRGPHPGITAIVYIVLFMSSITLFPLLAGGSRFPSPFGDIKDFQQLLLQYPDALKVNALLQLAAAIPLGIFTASVVARLRSSGMQVAGVSIAFFGGCSASLLISISGLFSWILCQKGIADNMDIVRMLRLGSFGAGGIAHIAALGLLMAGISVPCLIGKLTRPWIPWLGLVLALLAELSVFSFVFEQVFFLLPVVRFGSYIWMVNTGFALMRNKKS
jgi:hypothetical protein